MSGRYLGMGFEVHSPVSILGFTDIYGLASLGCVPTERSQRLTVPNIRADSGKYEGLAGGAARVDVDVDRTLKNYDSRS